MIRRLYYKEKFDGDGNLVFKCFCVKQIGVFLLPLSGDTSPSQVTSQDFVKLSPSNLLVPIYIYTSMKKGTVRVKCFA